MVINYGLFLQMRSYLGDACQWTADCVTAHSICHGGSCVCKEGFYEDSERIQCKPIRKLLNHGMLLHIFRSIYNSYHHYHHTLGLMVHEVTEVEQEQFIYM